MATVTMPEEQLVTEEAATAIGTILSIYWLSVHYPKLHSALMWVVTGLEYAERAGTLAIRGVKALLRIIMEAMILEAAGISDAIEALF